MATTKTHPATGLPSGGSMARLLHRALTFLAIAFGLLAPAQTYAVDYTVNTVSHSGGLQLTVTNISDTSDTLEVSGTGSDVTFAAAGRTFSLNGAAAVTGSLTTAIPTTANNNSYITLYTQGGDDVINLGTIAGVLPSIYIDGGLGADTLNVTGTLAQSSVTSPPVDLAAETVNFGPSSSWSANGGMSLIADTVEIDPTATLSLGSGLILGVQTALRELVLGAEVAGTLSLTDAELDRITTASLSIGDVKVRVKGDITRAAATFIQILVCELIFDGGTLYSGGASFQLLDCSIRCPFPAVAFGDGSLLDLAAYDSPPTLSLAISGATYPQYERLDTQVAPTFGGSFLPELILTKVGGYTPVPGDAFTVVNNLSASPFNGNFSDLEEGAKMANFLGSGLEAQITYTGGDGNDVVVTVLAPQPEIAVEQPAGTNLTSGTSTVAFGDSLLGAVAQKTFTVKNTGAAPLTLGAISITGANAGDFTVTTPPSSPVAATSGSTTFTVSFRPGATGARSATLSLPNNDTTGSEAPFLISLTGNGTGSAIVASFASPGYVTGGWEQNEVFTIGTVGTANPGNNWPAAESPDKATDGNVDTKFLIFQSSFSGLLLRPANNAIAYNRLALTTANDAPERDPQAYFIYGLATAPSSTAGTNIPFSGRTEIARGILNLPEARKTGPTVVQFDNTTAYPAYLLVFEDVKNNTNNNLTQIAEVKLSQGMTVPNQVAVGKVRGGRLSAGNWIPGSIRQPGDPDGNNWPAAESPDHALDGDTSTKYLHFQGPNAALGIQPKEGYAVINRVSFWTANDVVERDPTSYAVYGMNSLLNPFDGSTPDPWVLLGSGSLALPADRNAGPITVNFTNTTSYQYYAVVFPTVKNVPFTTLLTQISEVAFANVPPNVAPTNIALSNTSIPENNTAGATIGTLTATDANAGDTHTFSLASGGVDNAAFTIDGNALTINGSADYETKSSYSIRIRATDSGTGSFAFEKNFLVTITDVMLPQTITFNPPATALTTDTITLSATAGSGLPVTFSVSSLGATSGNTLIFTGDPGEVEVRAFQTGNADYLPAEIYQTITVSVPPGLATVTTATESDVTTTSATLGGEVTSDGDHAVTERGIVWGGPTYPTILDNKVANGTGTGSFSATVTGLNPGTTINVRAYATNSVGTSYGPPILFSTPRVTVVTNANSIGEGTLQQAVENANSNPGPDTITFDPVFFATFRTIRIETNQTPAYIPEMTGDTTIIGPAIGVRINSDRVYEPVFRVAAGATVTMDRIRTYRAQTGIKNNGTLTVSNCVFVEGNGEGIQNNHIATVTNCSFEDYSVALTNGDSPINAAATLTMSESSIISCDKGIVNRGIATISGCTSDNTLTEGEGTVINHAGASLSVINSSFIDASVVSGIFNNVGTLAIQNCTLVENGSSASSNDPAGIVTLKNTIYRRLPASAATTDGGGNLILNSTGSLPTNLAADLTTLGLDPTGLQNNGGPTKTFKLLTGAAVNGGVNANVPVGLITDQRGSGFPRSVGTVDIGAYEVNKPVSVLATTASAAEGTGAGTTAFTFTVNRPVDTTEAVTMDWAITGTGTSPADAADFGGTFPSGTLTLGIGVASDTIVIQVNKDTILETDETFTLTLSNPTASHAIVGSGAVATILNDDTNAAPTFTGYAFSTAKNTQASVGATKILTRAADADGGTLALTGVSAASAQGGSVSLSSGKVLYTPANNFTGLDTFSVTISDGQGGTLIGTITVSVTTDSGEGLNRAQLSIQPNGNVALLFMAIPGQQYVIERSSDLQTWTPIFTGPAAADGSLPFTDTSPLPDRGFYRTAIPEN